MLRTLRWGGALLCLSTVALGSAVGCGDSGTGGGGGTPGDPGAIVDVTMSSKVGVLLDELPMSMRDRVANALIAKDPSFWTDRAKAQVNLTGYRLVFRTQFDDPETPGGPAKDALPIPLPNAWNIALGGAPARTTIDGHDLVVVDYTL